MSKAFFVIKDRYDNGMTKSPLDLSDEYLVRTFQFYEKLDNRSKFEQFFLESLKDEIDRRCQFTFNKTIIDQLFEIEV
jgi:hypothetical protein